MSKLQESESRLNRAVTKAVTNCGCVKLSAEKQVLCSDKENCDSNLHQSPSSHITGNLCENCVDIIESELGNHFFYLFSLCNTLNINLYDNIYLHRQQNQNHHVFEVYHFLKSKVFCT